MSSKKVIPPDSFFVEHPPGVVFSIATDCSVGDIGNPFVDLPCPGCCCRRTYTSESAWGPPGGAPRRPAPGTVSWIRYSCTLCSKGKASFLVKVCEDGNGLLKLGQDPPWQKEVAERIRDHFPEFVGFFQRALDCEALGYGLGAYGYYRRAVEEVIDQLLESMERLVQLAEVDRYRAALKKAKERKTARMKIEMVKDMFPPILRPEGINPLRVLHTMLCDGIQSGDESECLDSAASLREAVLFVIDGLSDLRKPPRHFTRRVKALLKRRDIAGEGPVPV